MKKEGKVIPWTWSLHTVMSYGIAEVRFDPLLASYLHVRNSRLCRGRDWPYSQPIWSMKIRLFPANVLVTQDPCCHNSACSSCRQQTAVNLHSSLGDDDRDEGGREITWGFVMQMSLGSKVAEKGSTEEVRMDLTCRVHWGWITALTCATPVCDS